jgi:predicted alpha/beta superfamily hydrolase
MGTEQVKARNVDVWLPPGYENDGEERYPVLYMHDGQNVFHSNNAFGKVSWGVAEALTEGIVSGRMRPAIVVAIWHASERGKDYQPVHRLPGDEVPGFVENPGAASYLAFCADELKPFIDRSYRTLSDPANTLMMGSSLGGLISLYAICQRPEMYGAVACVSTHWPGSDGAMLEYLENHVPPAASHRIYFDYGSETLDSRYAPFQKRADEILLANDYQHGENWITQYFPGDAHDEPAWRERVHVPLEFLLKHEGRQA